MVHMWDQVRLMICIAFLLKVTLLSFFFFFLLKVKLWLICVQNIVHNEKSRSTYVESWKQILESGEYCKAADLSHWELYWAHVVSFSEQPVLKSTAPVLNFFYFEVFAKACVTLFTVLLRSTEIIWSECFTLLITLQNRAPLVHIWML